MQVFDEKVAPHHIQFEAFGVQMRVCTNTPELLSEVEQMLPPGWQRMPRAETPYVLGLMGEPDDETYAIYRHDSACIHDAPGRGYALTMMESQISGYIALHADDYVFVHAGVVADGDRAIVIPGLSFSGKTTLVRALVEAGAIYYSDEFAAIDEDGLVHPYPRRLSIRPLLEGDSTTIGSPTVERSVEQLGGVAGTAPLPAGVVVVTHYVPGAEWQPQELTGGAGVLAVLRHAVPAQERPSQSMRFVGRALEGATVLEGERGDADEFAQVLLETLRTTA